MYKTKRFFFQQVLRYGLNASQKVIVPLECVKEDLIKTFNVNEEKVVVTKEGYDSSISNGKEQMAKSNENYFLYVGNAYPHKNLENLIKGFLLFKSKLIPSVLTGTNLLKGEDDKEFKLLFVGKKDYFYDKFEKQYKHNTDIVFMHTVSDSELAKLYREANAFVSASLMEGFGLPPLEAMANGCVPLLSDIPSFREVCGSGAIYFDQIDPQKISSAMLEWMKVSQSEKKKLVDTGRNRVKIFSWKTMAEETKRLYEGSTSLRSSK